MNTTVPQNKPETAVPTLSASTAGPQPEEISAKTQAFFLNSHPGRLFLRMAIPGAVSMLASSLYVFLDGIFVGRLLGNEAFAALNFVFPLVILNFAIADLVGVGSSVPISIGLGRGQDREANNIFSCSCVLIAASGAVMGAVLYLFAPALVRLMGADGSFARSAVEYLRVYALCSPVTTIVFAVDNYLKICSRVRTSMVLNILMSFLGAGFEFVFLFVFGWGIAGAAAGSCLSMFLCAALALGLFARGDLQLRFCRPRPTRSMMRRILACGAPTLLSNLSGRISAILINILLVRFGGASAVSIFGMLMYADSFIASMIYGTLDSMQPAVGYNYGAGKQARVRSLERYCFSYSGVISLVPAIVLVLFPDRMVTLFIKDVDADFIRTATVALRLFCLCYLTRWFVFSTQSYLQAIAAYVPATILTVCQSLLFPVLLLVLLYPARLTGLWLNVPLTMFCAAVLAFFLLRTHWPRSTPSGPSSAG